MSQADIKQYTRTSRKNYLTVAHRGHGMYAVQLHFNFSYNPLGTAYFIFSAKSLLYLYSKISFHCVINFTFNSNSKISILACIHHNSFH